MTGEENLAVQGKAAQSSVYGSRDAYKAIDGSRSPTSSPANGSCSHTAWGLNPWWRLALPKTHKVFSIKITNRDAFQQRLNGDSLGNTKLTFKE
ncbi:hypothetical protein KUCAC02_004308 [Chaenocephalus aceratus]|uniref:Uncharacterized protein n=1 Tax=Chaenocephalus aceratus TaxID=36190 RepID=A0ACB9WZ22_CHAAC|nr:hypothetical protein KUCAC02_004308 [Chaenocephalus aceratus]